MINVCVLVGRIATEPEMRYTTSGLAVISFRLAVNRRRKSQDGEEQADFLDIKAFGKTAELVAQYLDKGAPAGIEGHIQVREWKTNEGQPRRSVEIVAEQVQFIESRQEAERRRAAKGTPSPPAATPSPPAATAQPPPPSEQDAPLGENEDPFGDQ